MHNDRDETAIDEYFSELGENKAIGSYDIFKARIGYEITEGQSVTKIIEHFWQASRSASLIPSINKFAEHKTTAGANKFMSRKLAGIYSLFSSRVDEVTAEDLEKIMALHMRLQTVPTPEFFTQWVSSALDKIDQFSDEWFKANFDHFTKLGIYPQDEFMIAWWDTVKSRIDQFDPGDQFRILYKMAQFDFLRTHDFKEVCDGIPSPCRQIADHVFDLIKPRIKNLFFQKINNQIVFAGLWFGKEFVTDIPLVNDDNSYASELEKTLVKSIGATSITVNDAGIIVPVTGHIIDLKLGHDRKIYGCEVDGISHFNRISGATPSENAVIYNASTRFHSWLIAQYLPDINIIRIPYFLFDREAKGIPWEKTLSRIARKDGHSIYAWHGGSIARDLQTEKNAHIFRGHDL